jgi:outer membrane receptor protein involved in Fe transport
MKKNLINILGSVPKYLSRTSMIILGLTLIALTQNPVMAQDNPTAISADKVITGKIISDIGVPLSGVTVGVKNSNRATVTNTEGEFTISVSVSSVLIVSHIGYITQELPVSGRTNFQITLISSEKTLSDVVVVGYTSQKKSSITGAISAVNMNDLAPRRVPDVAQLLQGQVAGVQVTQSTGAPGDGINITIRGVGTIGSSSDPLFIVDGLPTTDISFINPPLVTMTITPPDALAP